MQVGLFFQQAQTIRNLLAAGARWLETRRIDGRVRRANSLLAVDAKKIKLK
jgi:hypothetical protein